MKTFRNIIALLLMLPGLHSNAQNEMLEVVISKDTVLFGNQVKVSFIASNISGSFVPPSFEGFNIISGPFTSSSYSYINGDESRKTTYIYLLEPIKIGRSVIGKASYKSNDREFMSSEIEIYVKANPEGIQESPEKTTPNKRDDFFEGFGSMEDLFNSPDLRSFRTIPNEPAPKPVKPKYKFKTEKI